MRYKLFSNECVLIIKRKAVKLSPGKGRMANTLEEKRLINEPVIAIRPDLPTVNHSPPVEITDDTTRVHFWEYKT